MNKKDYKKAVDQIHASKELKEKTIRKIQEKNNIAKYIKIRRCIALCAVALIIFSVGFIYMNNQRKPKDINQNQIANANNDLPKFENMEQLREAIQKGYNTNNSVKGDILEDTMAPRSINGTTESATQQKETDYSKTNVQVEGVDEADIVKTDGKYIYYVQNLKVYVIDTENLSNVSTIDYEKDDENFSPREIYINDDKLIVIGNEYKYNYSSRNYPNAIYDTARAPEGNREFAKAIVYDLNNKEKPKKTREVAIDGYYNTSRMIGDNIYFISEKSIYYYDEIKNIDDNELLPLVKDSASDEKETTINCTDIVYFRNTRNYTYTLVAGFNVNERIKANVETFFGANGDVYASSENLYITQTEYNDNYTSEESLIYKFNLKDSDIILQCKGSVKGDLNNQFSMDEYRGNLRIATTSYGYTGSKNQLYVLDENLNEIGKLEGLAKGERIYSVRFVERVAYIVTFKEIDPLLVVDLSDPRNPVLEGKLKIPGYSSYLHPYDETHIIGIGYNTETNKYGGTTTSTIKMSMFDVSDLSDPKEMFNVSIGDGYSYSEIINNHKALFYNKEKNLIGFPVSSNGEDWKDRKNIVAIYKIDLEKGFEKYADIVRESNYKTNVNRMIYIGDILYTLSDTEIISYDINTTEKIRELKFE